jgi:outer membrane protein OmpA-like peptidoglycan-associated protein
MVVLLIGVLGVGAAMKLMGERKAETGAENIAAEGAGKPLPAADQNMRGMAGTIGQEGGRDEPKADKTSASAAADSAVGAGAGAIGGDSGAGGKPASGEVAQETVAKDGAEVATAAATVASGSAAESVAKPAEPALRMDTDFASAKRIVPFAFNRVGVGPVGTLAVSELAPLAKQAQTVYVRGRTDSRGDRESNQQVALNRAFTVRSAFVNAGVARSKLRISFCTTCFIAPNDTEQGRRANRRVDVELIMPADEIAKLPKPVHALEYPETPDQRLALTQSINALAAKSTP